MAPPCGVIVEFSEHCPRHPRRKRSGMNSSTAKRSATGVDAIESSTLFSLAFGEVSLSGIFYSGTYLIKQDCMFL